MERNNDIRFASLHCFSQWRKNGRRTFAFEKADSFALTIKENLCTAAVWCDNASQTNRLLLATVQNRIDSRDKQQYSRVRRALSNSIFYQYILEWWLSRLDDNRARFLSSLLTSKIRRTICIDISWFLCIHRCDAYFFVFMDDALLEVNYLFNRYSRYFSQIRYDLGYLN